MINFYYTLSPILRDSLEQVEKLRQKILLTPLPPHIEVRLRWEAQIERVFWSLALSKSPLHKYEVVKLFTKANKKALSKEEQDVINYKTALNFIGQDWLVSSKNVSPATLITLHRIAVQGNFTQSESFLKELMDYIQSGQDHPVIQAAIAMIQLEKNRPFSKGNGRVSRLASYLFLYKYGYDMRGLLVLEEFWRRDFDSYQTIVKESIDSDNLTLWLTYFVKSTIAQLEKAVQNTAYPDFKIDTPAEFWKLNNRQKEVLVILEEPKKTITNRDVQKRFKISQITASRDLAQLAQIGLLFPHGKGRSVRYSKV